MRRVLKRALAALCLLTVTILLASAGCAGGGDGKGPGGGLGGGGGSSGADGSAASGGSGGDPPSGVCLLNNCTSDDQCVGCSYGRTKCDTSQNRCVACDPATGQGCPASQKCTSFGICAPEDLTCPTDGNGEPTISCSGDQDCLACDPLHQVCSGGKCVACKSSDTTHCLGSEQCTSTGKCEPKCPLNCTSNGDCSSCVLGGKQATACNNHVCSECSDSKPCPAGLECKKGQCVKACGLTDQTGKGAACKTSNDCFGCGNTETSTTAWECKYPVNGGTHGTCAHPAAGCSDLGNAVLPPPFDSVTNLCSKPEDCAGVAADINIGKLIRDLVGNDEILGVKINDASISYAMNSCASVEIKDKSCGVCVPCQTDADCKPVPLDPLIADLLGGNALAQLAAAYLMDQLFGKDNHQIHMQCLPVAGGYGACVPCSNPTKGCGAGSTGPVGSGTCNHDVCETGDPLDPSCGLCAEAICEVDNYCCNNDWDQLCVDLVDDLCAVSCDGKPTVCTHNPCKIGTAMNPTCSPCVSAVCDQDPFCCNPLLGSWDQTCVDIANSKPAECLDQCGGTSSCAHNECEQGGPLNPSCSNCAQVVCAQAPVCCNVEWDFFCAQIAISKQECGCS